jgi:hypothetical protein
MTPELLDRDLRIDPVSEPLYRKAFVSEIPIERFVGAVLSRLSWVDVRGVYVERGEPLQHGSGHKLRTVVRHQRARSGRRLQGAPENAGIKRIGRREVQS